MKKELWDKASDIKREMFHLEQELFFYGDRIENLKETCNNSDYIDIQGVKVDSKKLLEILPKEDAIKKRIEELNIEFENL